MTETITQETIAGFEAPVHRALTEPILLAGAPRAVAILNGTLSADADPRLNFPFLCRPHCARPQSSMIRPDEDIIAPC
jgi:hypothetical protein